MPDSYGRLPVVGNCFKLVTFDRSQLRPSKCNAALVRDTAHRFRDLLCCGRPDTDRVCAAEPVVVHSEHSVRAALMKRLDRLFLSMGHAAWHAMSFDECSENSIGSACRFAHGGQDIQTIRVLAEGLYGCHNWALHGHIREVPGQILADIFIDGTCDEGERVENLIQRVLRR